MRKIILGTDWFTDCDDAVAIRLITNAVKNKKIQLLGVAINVCMKYSVASLKGFLNAEGIENVPIGIDFEAIESEEESSYQKRLMENFCPLQIEISSSMTFSIKFINSFCEFASKENNCLKIIFPSKPIITVSIPALLTSIPSPTILSPRGNKTEVFLPAPFVSSLQIPS